MRRSVAMAGSLLLAALVTGLLLVDDSLSGLPARYLGEDRFQGSFTLPRRFASQPPFQPRVEVVATNLDLPWALTFAPDGRLFFTERSGRIRVIAENRLLPDPVAVLPAQTRSGDESGLLGLALDPAFQDNGFLYVLYSFRDGERRLVNRISRLKMEGNLAGEETVLLDGIPGAGIHDGGRLKFAPDGTLFATTGDAANPQNSQDQTSLSGKILRLNADGSIPDDNPFPGSPIYTLGHRNPEGLAFQPSTGQLFSTEHGPVGNDEVNVISAGKNYGWPVVQGIAGNPSYVDPILAFTPSVAPSGATFYDGDRLSDWVGNLFFTTLRGQHLHRVVLGGADGDQVISDERLFDGVYGRLRDVIQGPDGFLYFSTSNRDGRGSLTAGDDRILRIVPQ